MCFFIQLFFFFLSLSLSVTWQRAYHEVGPLENLHLIVLIRKHFVRELASRPVLRPPFRLGFRARPRAGTRMSQPPKGDYLHPKGLAELGGGLGDGPKADETDRLAPDFVHNEFVPYFIFPVLLNPDHLFVEMEKSGDAPLREAL